MIEETVLPSVSPSSPEASVEIDLRTFATGAARRWRSILMIFLAAIGIAIVAYYGRKQLQPPQFEAFSDIAIARTTSQLAFDERFTTASTQNQPANFAAQRSALLSLAVSPVLAPEVLELIGDRLPDAMPSKTKLADSIRAELVVAPGARAGESDLIRITTLGSTPEVAEMIADAWAEVYVRRANQAFGIATDDLLASVLEERATAEVEFEAARRALEERASRSQIESLSRRLVDIAATINVLLAVRQDTMAGLGKALVDSNVSAVSAVAKAQGDATAAPIVAEQNGLRDLRVATIDALYDTRRVIFSQQVERDLTLLDRYYSRLIEVTTALDEALALKDQSSATGESLLGSNKMVLALLRLQSMTSVLDVPENQANDLGATAIDVQSAQPAGDATTVVVPGVLQANLPVQVQVNTPALQLTIDDSGTVSRDQFIGELDQLIEMLRGRKTELETQIGELSQSLLDGNRYQFLGETIAEDSSLSLAVSAITASDQTTASVVSAAPRPELVDATAMASSIETVLASGLAEVEIPNDNVQSHIEQLETTEREYRSTLEGERAELARLEQRRDIALETLRTITSKADELRVSRAAAGTVVKPVGEAVANDVPVEGFSLPFVIALSLFASFIVALLYVAWTELQRISSAAK